MKLKKPPTLRRKETPKTFDPTKTMEIAEEDILLEEELDAHSPPPPPPG